MHTHSAVQRVWSGAVSLQSDTPRLGTIVQYDMYDIVLRQFEHGIQTDGFVTVIERTRVT